MNIFILVLLRIEVVHFTQKPRFLPSHESQNGGGEVVEHQDIFIKAFIKKLFIFSVNDIVLLLIVIPLIKNIVQITINYFINLRITYF